MDNELLAPPLEWFDRWMATTGEPIPDFEALPSMPELPDLLRFEDGTAVAGPADWSRRRRELSGLVQHWLIGSWPTNIPLLSSAEIVAAAEEQSAVWRRVRLTFSEPLSFSFDIEIIMPADSGPHPVFLTQASHRRWAALGVSRGYLCCVYPGADADDRSDRLKEVYPKHDWSKLTRRAWLGCRALDYVLTLDQADAEAVGITGHSRNGKQSLIAAAMDERITAVISSGSGSGGVVPWRCSSEFCFQESVEFMSRQRVTAEWFHPRIRLFAGREDRLPVDTHALLGLIAPRACLVSDAMTDGCGSTFGVEMGVEAARPVYEMLDGSGPLDLMWRWGNHETDAQVVGRYFDWLDTVFGRAGHEFSHRRLHGLPVTLPDAPPPPPLSAAADTRLRWLLGDAPPAVSDPGGRYGAMPLHRASMVGMDKLPDGVRHLALNFAEYVRGDLFFPALCDAALTPVIWLHPFSHSYGAAGAYMVGGQVFHRLAQEGYAVLAFTQIGCAQRTEEGRDFYRRYPRWSKMGKMVRDVHGAIDLLTREKLGCAGAIAASPLELPALDPERLTLLGYSLGGLTALLAAALDDRVRAVASFCGALPFREQPPVPARGCMQRFWQLPDLLPRLPGAGKPMPFGLDDLLGMVAPRPCLLVAPTHDRELDVDAVRANVRKVLPYPALSFRTPDDYNRFQTDQHAMILEWLREG